MASIYRGAFFVIAADCAHDADAGFLADPPQDCPVAFAQVRNLDGSACTIHATRTPQHSGFGDALYPAHLGPLSTRGWTKQEQLLARRIIHFGTHELVWQCETDFHCECETAEQRSERLTEDISGRREFHSLQTLVQDFQRGRLGIWHRHIGEYFRRQLTDSRDFLPALSGITSFLQTQGAGRNLAGLWENHLQTELLWRSLRHSTRVDYYRAPSWSWSSINDAELQHWDSWNNYVLPQQSKCEIIHASVVPEGHDPNGRVSSGTLQIRGHLAFLHDLLEVEEGVQVEDDFEIPVAKMGSLDDQPLSPLLQVACFFDDWEAALEDYKDSKDFYMLLVAWSKIHQDADDEVLDQFKAEGLILAPLERTTAEEPHAFHRVGLWSTMPYNSAQDPSESPFEPPPAAEILAFFEQQHEHIVTII